MTNPLLSEPIIGSCKICGVKNVKVYEINPGMNGCAACISSTVLPRREMMEGGVLNRKLYA
ncbi:MAG: hypothetical protein Q8O93_01440 [bacterium]|nr:hypothetical protein [bacterium]